MSLPRPPNIEVTYLRIIDDTVAAASCFQSPAVLEQLKQRWIEKLKQKLYSAPKKEGYSTPVVPPVHELPQKIVQSHPVSLPQSSDVLVLEKSSVISQNAQIYCENKKEETNVHEKTTTTITATTETTTTMETTTETATITLQENDADGKSRKYTITDMRGLNGKEEDDWDTEEWEPAVSEADACCIQPKIESNTTIEQAINETTPSKSVGSSMHEVTAVMKTMESGKRGLIVESEQDLYDDLDEIDEQNLSDLEDHDPVYSDVLVAQFESVQRPHARKPSLKGMWKLKLRRGILQIDGQELLFNTMTGDLSF